VIVRCPQCKEETRLREYTPGDRVVSFLCPACDKIVRLDLSMDEVKSSSAATSYDRTEHARRVLVADDTMLVRRMARMLLEEAGFEVIEAKDGLETMRRVREDHPDLVLLDLVMPKMTGFDVLREIRKDVRVREIPVLVMSGVYKEDIVIFLQQLGARGFIDKDTLHDSLVFRVSSVLPAPPVA
jgi:CheY-like chemotaxis protein